MRVAAAAATVGTLLAVAPVTASAPVQSTPVAARAARVVTAPPPAAHAQPGSIAYTTGTGAGSLSFYSAGPWSLAYTDNCAAGQYLTMQSQDAESRALPIHIDLHPSASNAYGGPAGDWSVTIATACGWTADVVAR